MKKIYYLSIVLLALTTISCSFLENCVEGEGTVVNQAITVDQFDGIVLKSNAIVYVKQSTEQKVSIEAPQNIIDLLKTEVSRGTWHIDFSRCPKTKEPILIYIESNNFKEISIEGSGKIISEEKITSNELEIDISGSGSVDLNLSVKELRTEINGAGDVRLRGSTKLHDVEINGSGDIEAYDLATDESDIEINGSGDVKVTVSYALKVEINGSGDVYYKGNVKKISSEINGSGRLNQQ